MTPEDKKIVDSFMAELKELQVKYGIELIDYSCGCCGYTYFRETATKRHIIDLEDWEKQTQ